MENVIYKFLDNFLLRLGRFEARRVTLDGIERTAGPLHGGLVAVLTRPPPASVYQVLNMSVREEGGREFV